MLKVGSIGGRKRRARDGTLRITGQVTFSRRARDGLTGVTLGEAVSRIDAWYAANPGRLETPGVAVMWLDIAKPKLQGRR